MANTSPTVLLRLRSYANPAIGVITWPLQRPAVLHTSVLAAMARTELQFAQLTHPTNPARLPSALRTLHHLGPAASLVGCRPAQPPSYCLLLVTSLVYFSSHTPRGFHTKSCIGSSSSLIKIVVPVVIFVC